MLLSLHRGPKVYRLRPGQGVDSYGDPIEDWDNPVRELLYQAVLQEPDTEEEDGAGNRLVTGQRVLYAPRALDLQAEDRVEVDGQLWRVQGDPKIRRGLAMGVYTSATLARTDRRRP